MPRYALAFGVLWREAWLPFPEGVPHAGSGVVRIDPLCFLARCHKKRLNQALSVSLSIGFFVCTFVLFNSALFVYR